MNSRITIADAQDAALDVLGDINDELRKQGLPGIAAFTISRKIGDRMRALSAGRYYVKDKEDAA